MATAPKKRVRPIRSPYYGRHIDRRTYTRPSSLEERILANAALEELSVRRLQVVLVPAPEAHFSGHMVRAVENRNPEWYRDLIGGYPEGFVKRCRIEKALRRVVMGRVRGNGWERRLLPILEREAEIRGERRRRAD